MENRELLAHWETSNKKHWYKIWFCYGVLSYQTHQSSGPCGVLNLEEAVLQATNAMILDTSYYPRRKYHRAK